MTSKLTLPLIFISLLTLTIKVYCQETEFSDEEILEMYEGLRVADVSDGMDFVGLPDVGLLDQKIVALWKDIDDFSHRFCGIAITARYIPTNKVVRPPKDAEEFRKWEGNWYNEYSPEPFTTFIKKGAVVVLDVEGDGDTGSVGSANSLGWVQKGAVGIVSNGGIRDTDEIILQKIPVYLDMDNRGRGIRPGRNEIESVNKPVSLGGVQIRPGDIIIADGDGVICVPREHAKPVSDFAKLILEGDKKARLNLYKSLGKELDETVLPDKD